jgi:hypothetical protein
MRIVYQVRRPERWFYELTSFALCKALLLALVEARDSIQIQTGATMIRMADGTVDNILCSNSNVKSKPPRHAYGAAGPKVSSIEARHTTELFEAIAIAIAT